MDIRGIDLDRILEHGLDEFNDRCFCRVRVDRKLIDIDPAFAQLQFYFCRQRVDLIRATIHDVDRTQKIRFLYQGQTDRPF